MIIGVVGILTAIASLFTLYDGEAVTARVLRIVTPLFAGLALIGAWAAVRFYRKLGVGFFLILVITVAFAVAFPIVLKVGIHAQSLTVLAIAILLAGSVYGPREAKVSTWVSICIVSLLFAFELFGWFGFSTPQNTVTAPVMRFLNFVALFIGTGWLVSAYSTLFRQTLERLEVKNRELSDSLTVRLESDSKRSLVEASLQQSAQLLEASQSIAKVGGWDLDLRTKVLFWTAETYRIHDTSPEEFIPTKDAGVGYFLPESRRIISDALQAAMERGEGYDLELQTLTTKGRLIDVRTTCEVTLLNGRPVKLTGIFQDITERKRAESASRYNEAQYRSLFDNSMDAVLQTRPDGSILSANAAACALFALTEQELIHGGRARIVDTADPHFAEFLKIRAATGSASGELRMRRGDGSLFDAEISSNVYSDLRGGSLTSMLIRNVTERKRAETALIAGKEAAEASNLAKSQFLANMSHEIRTPMNGILGMAQLLLMDGIAEATRKEYVRVILGSGKTLLTLLNDILDLSKVEAGKLDLITSPFNPANLLNEIAVLFNELGQEKGLVVTAHWMGNDRRYLGDAIRLRQMLSNLLSNAIKFSDTGTIVMTATEVSSTTNVAAPESLVEFSVQDNGIGLTSEQQAMLFQPFTQVDGSATRRFGGTGLGLSIVRRLAEQMGGSVGVVSELGKGARFWFRVRLGNLPGQADARAVGREVAAERIATPTKASESFTVLVVEDNPINRMVAKGLLEQLGCKVTLAENGAVALALLKGWNGALPQLVLMDCQMPVMDGFAATAAIRLWESEQGLSRMRIVALTAGAFTEDRDHCIAAGMDDFLAKPVAADALAALVNV